MASITISLASFEALKARISQLEPHLPKEGNSWGSWNMSPFHGNWWALVGQPAPEAHSISHPRGEPGCKTSERGYNLWEAMGLVEDKMKYNAISVWLQFIHISSYSNLIIPHLCSHAHYRPNQEWLVWSLKEQGKTQMALIVDQVWVFHSWYQGLTNNIPQVEAEYPELVKFKGSWPIMHLISQYIPEELSCMSEERYHK